MSLFDNPIHQAAHREALEHVLAARRDQVHTQGYDATHDDEHHRGELAIAGSLAVLPSRADIDLVHADGGSLEMSSLFATLEDLAGFSVRKQERAPLPEGAFLEVRIANTAVGVSLGLAELERLIRRRNTLASADPAAESAVAADAG